MRLVWVLCSKSVLALFPRLSNSCERACMAWEQVEAKSDILESLPLPVQILLSLGL